MANPLRASLAPDGGSENDGCDFVFARPLQPGWYWVRLDGRPEHFALEIRDGEVRDASPVFTAHPAWPDDVRTVADTAGRVEWFIYPEQYATEDMVNTSTAEAAAVLSQFKR